jgi:NADH pyrophosphatase NudC (nudix superfamily)
MPEKPLLNQSEPCFVFRGAELILPPGSDERRIIEGIPAETVRTAFKQAEIKYFEVPAIDRLSFMSCFSLAKNTALPSGWRNIPRRTLVAGLAAENPASATGSPLFRASHILQWFSDSVFCGSCGAKNWRRGG